MLNWKPRVSGFDDQSVNDYCHGAHRFGNRTGLRLEKWAGMGTDRRFVEFFIPLPGNGPGYLSFSRTVCELDCKTSVSSQITI